MIRVKNVHDERTPDDGFRVLVDRIWPRGVTKERAGIDLWLKDVAPSTELRQWFDHDPARWDEFRRRYARELAGKGEALALLRRHAQTGTLTLVFGARDREHNNAVALREVLLGSAPKS